MQTHLAHPHSNAGEQREVRKLWEEDRHEVLAILQQNPAQSVILRGLILDYGLCGAELRGSFYGYFADHRLAAVALLGHQIIVFGADESLPHFAHKAAELKVRGYLILGPQTQVETLWNYLSRQGRTTQRMSAQRLYVCRQPRQKPDRLQLLQANFAELDMVVNAQAEMALEQSGIDPRLKDLAGFRHRVEERIERKRVWVKIEEGKVIFKADLFSNTPEAVYLEGVWVHPNYRERGVAKSCLTELVHRLLKNHQTVCLIANEEEKAAHQVYEHVGFVHTADYEARFLTPPV